jgi:hypothetical protein
MPVQKEFELIKTVKMFNVEAMILSKSIENWVESELVRTRDILCEPTTWFQTRGGDQNWLGGERTRRKETANSFQT